MRCGNLCTNNLDVASSKHQDFRPAGIKFNSIWLTLRVVRTERIMWKLFGYKFMQTFEFVAFSLLTGNFLLRNCFFFVC